MWDFLQQVLTLWALTFPVTTWLELPSREQQRTGLCYRCWSRGCCPQSQFSPLLPTHFSLKMVVLRRCLFHFWEGSKEGMCCKCVRTEMCQFIPKVGCVWVTPSVSGHTVPRVGHAPVRLFTPTFTCFVLSGYTHGCFATIQDKMSKTRQDYSGGFCCVMQINTKKWRLSVRIHSLSLQGASCSSVPHRERCFTGRVVLGAQNIHTLNQSVCSSESQSSAYLTKAGFCSVWGVGNYSPVAVNLSQLVVTFNVRTGNNTRSF